MCCISFASGSRYCARSSSATLSTDITNQYHVTTGIVMRSSREDLHSGRSALDDLRAPVEVEVEHVSDEVRRHAVLRERHALEAADQTLALPLIAARPRRRFTR